MIPKYHFPSLTPSKNPKKPLLKIHFNLRKIRSVPIPHIRTSEVNSLWVLFSIKPSHHNVLETGDVRGVFWPCLKGAHPSLQDKWWEEEPAKSWEMVLSVPVGNSRFYMYQNPRQPVDRNQLFPWCLQPSESVSEACGNGADFGRRYAVLGYACPF